MSTNKQISLVAGGIAILLLAVWIGQQRQPAPGEQSQEARSTYYSRQPNGPGSWAERDPQEHQARLERTLERYLERLRDQAEQYGVLSETLRRLYLDELIEDEYDRRLRSRIRRWRSIDDVPASKLLDEQLASLSEEEQARIRLFREALDKRHQQWREDRQHQRH